jgi:hypothetical protein
VAYGEDRSAQVTTGILDHTIDRVAADGVDGFSEAYAEAVASTEVTRAITAGEAAVLLIVAAILGKTYRSIWHTERDGKVCEICAPLHGTGEEVYAAVSASGPPCHPRCRCWLDYEEDV